MMFSAAFTVCTAPAVGMETGDILDSQLSASTGDPTNARLNGPTAWGAAYPDDTNGHIQVTRYIPSNVLIKQRRKMDFSFLARTFLVSTLPLTWMQIPSRRNLSLNAHKVLWCALVETSSLRLLKNMSVSSVTRTWIWKNIIFFWRNWRLLNIWQNIFEISYIKAMQFIIYVFQK